MTGFGVLADGGLAWCEDGEAVELSGIGDVFAQPTLNPLLASGCAPRRPAGEVELRLPFEVADYVDFYASLEHATNLGRLFRPDSEPLLPNWRWLPVAYHGRAGTVAVSGTDVVRPRGQVRAGECGPSRRLDVELEFGLVVGVPAWKSVSTADFAERVFGVVPR